MTDKETFIQNIIDSEIEYAWKLKRIAEIDDDTNPESIELQRQIDSDNETFAMWMEMYHITREEINAVREARLLEIKDELQSQYDQRVEDEKDNDVVVEPSPLMEVIPVLLESDTITTL